MVWGRLNVDCLFTRNKKKNASKKWRIFQQTECNVQIERVNARRERGKEKKNFIPIRKCDINSIDYYSCFVKDFSFSLSVSLPTDSNSEFFFLLHLSWWLEYTHTHTLRRIWCSVRYWLIGFKCSKDESIAKYDI